MGPREGEIHLCGDGAGLATGYKKHDEERPEKQDDSSSGTIECKSIKEHMANAVA